MIGGIHRETKDAVCIVKQIYTMITFFKTLFKGKNFAVRRVSEG